MGIDFGAAPKEVWVVKQASGPLPDLPTRFGSYVTEFPQMSLDSSPPPAVSLSQSYTGQHG
jgi:hypothetical protein